MKWKVEVERQKESREKMSVGLWHEDPPALRVPGVTLNREFFINFGVQEGWPIYNCLVVFFFPVKSHVTYFSLITCIIIVTKRKTSISLYTHNTPDTKCVGFPHQSIFQVSLVSPQLDVLQFNYDINYLQLAQAPQVKESVPQSCS